MTSPASERTASVEAPAAAAGSRRRPPAGLVALAGLVAPAAVFVAGQGLALLAVWAVAVPSGWRLWALLQSWDAGRLLTVARAGYTGDPGSAGGSLAFFPGYPFLVRGVSALTGLGPDVAGVGVSVAAGVALAYGVDGLAADLTGGRRTVRLTAVAVVAVLPLSVVLVMPYTEATFCALAVWALVFTGRRRWLPAGVLGCAAGLVRPTAVALLAALLLGAVAARPPRGPERVRAATAVVLVPLGTLAYLGWAAARTGRLTAWSDAEGQGWGTVFDFGAYTRAWIRTIAAAGPATMDVFLLAGAAACLAAVVAGLRGRLPTHVTAYVLAVLVLALGTSGVWNSKYRLLLPALVVVAVPAAGATARWGTPLRATVLVAAAAVGCWFSAFALTGYPYAI